MTDKKQLFRLFESIADINENQWNNKAGSFNDKQEAAYQIEEALEGFSGLAMLADQLNMSDEYADEISPKGISRVIVNFADYNDNIPDVDRLDKVIDGMYFGIGALHKLGLTPQDMVDALAVVHNHNLAKSGKKDMNGKVVKTNDFLSPEPELQKILDRRNA